MKFIDVVKEKATAKQITVYETSDFSIFNLNPCNRKINEKKVNDFMSQDIKDVIYPISSTGEILDGQHRIRACEKLGKSVKFQIIDNADADYIHDINTVGSVWNNADFMYHYEKRGIKDYCRLLKFAEHTCELRFSNTITSSITSYIVLLSGNLNSNNSFRINANLKNQYINGKFTIKVYPKWVENSLELFKELNNHIGFVSVKKQVSEKFVTSFYNFSMVLQAWAYQFNRTDIFSDFKKNLLLNIANLPKMVLNCNGDFISVFNDIRNKNKKSRFEYKDFEEIYLQNCSEGKYQSLIDAYFAELKN
jgi:hypothetical protein